jgi:plastocyanin
MCNVRLATLALAGMLSACGGGGDGGTQPPPPAVFTSLSIAPANPDLVLRDTVQMSATPRDQNGAAMAGLPAATFERVGTGTAVSVSATGRVIAEQTGSAQIRASVTSGGTTHTATANATVAALATTADVVVAGGGTSFSPDTVKIAVNGSVTWTFTSGANSPHNVTFATPPAGGNIGNTTTGAVTRTFANAGRFTYQCTLHTGMNGAVIVRTP